MKEKGLLWKLPVLISKDFGKLGPAFGFGAGCGLSFGVGLLGGVGISPGISGLQVSFGFGAGCGVGLGFGYGIGRGIAKDQYRRYSNIGNPFPSSANIIYEYPRGRLFPEYNREIQIPTNLFHAKKQDDITAIMDDLVISTKRLMRATSKEIEKWSR